MWRYDRKLTGRVGRVGRVGLVGSLVLVGSLGTAASAAGPRSGQIVVDPDHPRWLMRHGGGHLYVCGPGDPEDFLYRGERQPDGTRNGDQDTLIRKLIEYGGNCIYLQAVRSHGGDGERDHNPFVDSDPGKGLDEDILDQWERWFSRMDEHGILIYFFLFDDAVRLWGKKSDRRVPEPERAFVEAIVRRFQHHDNLIWIVAEEAEEALSTERVRGIAEIIRETDTRDHVIGCHHHSGTTFKTWKEGGPLTHYSMQLTAAGDNAHEGAITAFREAAGRYQVIYAEGTAAEPDIRHAWAVAMGGLMPMMLKMDIASTPAATLRRCRALQRFFEATDFWTMSPHDELAFAGTQWVLADPGRSAIAYSRHLPGDEMGLRGMPSGLWDLYWVDCVTGVTRQVNDVVVETGDRSFAPPPGIGRHCAVWMRRGRERPLSTVFPGTSWERRDPADAGLDVAGLEEFAQLAGGRGCIIRRGYMVHTWGDEKRSADVASASKPFYSHLLLRALENGDLGSVDERVMKFEPCLRYLNKELGYKDRRMTFRHLAYQAACLGYREDPGTAYDYNDATMGFFWDMVVNRVWGITWERAYERVFEPELVRRLEFEDSFSFATEGRKAGRPKISPRDFARFGLLYLHGGQWKTEQVLDRRLARMAVTSPLRLAVPRTAAETAEHCNWRSIGGGGNQTDHNGGYSWLWWTNGVARDGRRWWPDAPADMFLALGHCGREGLAVLPAEEIIVSWNEARQIHCERELGNRAFRALREAVRAE